MLLGHGVFIWVTPHCALRALAECSHIAFLLAISHALSHTHKRNAGEAMEKYYGLKPGEKQDLYGPPQPTDIDTERIGTNPFEDAEQGVEVNLVMPAQQRRQQPGSDARHGTPVQTTKMYDTAPSMNNSRHVDDFSFSNINLSTPSNSPGASSPGGRPTTPRSDGNATSPDGKYARLQKWIGTLTGSSGNDGPGYLPPNMTMETNIAPRPRNDPAEWHPDSPRVTFTNDFGPGCVTKKDGYWNGLGTMQKMGVATVWVALVCTIFGVMISQLGGNGVDDGEGGASKAVGVPGTIDAPAPVTSWPETHEPTTSRPTMKPATDAPIGGYYAVHSKERDGTPRPTRSPVTPRPTNIPTRYPTRYPTANPVTDGPTMRPTASPTTGSPTGSPTGAPVGCFDQVGAFTNHLSNPKDCAWLDNKAGFTDRKDKNCGGRSVLDESGNTVVYPSTQLGDRCRAACRLYNECPATAADTNAGSMTSMMGGGTSVVSAASCTDKEGTFSNHLENPKDCAWLGSREGHSDRKDKNCGGRPVEDGEGGGTIVYPTTELGEKCPGTCRLYNDCPDESAAEEVQEVKTTKMERSVPVRSNLCKDRTGLFLNHLLNPKTCEWLGNDKPGPTDRKDKNCGGAGYAATQLGEACAETCAEYRPERCEFAGEITVEGGHLMRSFSSAGYSFSLTSPEIVVGGGSGTSCMNGEGAYANHKGLQRKCSWLTGHGDDHHGNDDETRHRQAKNCGAAGSGHDITELGRECPWSCREHNDCGR